MQKITWEEYLFNSWHTKINNRTFYIHKAYDDNGEFFIEAEYYLIQILGA